MNNTTNPAESKSPDFISELRGIINKHSMENASNTPDFILAQYLTNCLRAWNQATQQRETWYGRDARPTCPPNVTSSATGGANQHGIMEQTTTPPDWQQRLVGPWEDPNETTAIPFRTSKWAATAAAQLCEALSGRSDTPSEFVRHLWNAHKALQIAVDALHEEWPNAQAEIPS